MFKFLHNQVRPVVSYVTDRVNNFPKYLISIIIKNCLEFKPKFTIKNCYDLTENNVIKQISLI